MDCFVAYAPRNDEGGRRRFKQPQNSVLNFVCGAFVAVSAFNGGVITVERYT